MLFLYDPEALGLWLVHPPKLPRFASTVQALAQAALDNAGRFGLPRGRALRAVRRLGMRLSPR